MPKRARVKQVELNQCWKKLLCDLGRSDDTYGHVQTQDWTILFHCTLGERSLSLHWCIADPIQADESGYLEPEYPEVPGWIIEKGWLEFLRTEPADSWESKAFKETCYEFDVDPDESLLARRDPVATLLADYLKKLEECSKLWKICDECKHLVAGDHDCTQESDNE